MIDGFFALIAVVGGLTALGSMISSWEKSQAAAKAKAAADAARAAEAAAKAADEAFLREHPEAWLARQRAGLERDRLAAVKKYADEESGRQTAGLAAGILRAFFK